MIKNLRHLNSILARRAYKYVDRWAGAYWHDAPLASQPRATKADYLKLWEAEKERAYPEIDAFEKQNGHEIDKTWMDQLALHTQIVVKTSPLCYQHGRILYSALRAYIKKQAGNDALSIVETGTGRGFSSLVMAKALTDSGQSGRIFTFDLLPHKTPLFWNCIDDHEGRKTRAALLAPWQDLVENHILFIEGDSRILLNKIGFSRIHFAFLDGAHSYRDVITEFGLINPFQKAGDIVVFDDYNPSDFPGVVRAVDEVCRIYGYEKNVISAGRERRYVVAVKK